MRYKTLHTVTTFALMVGANLQAQNVSTYAGVQYTDSGRFLGGADNPKNTELYSRPNGVAVYINGRIWISD